MIDIVNTLSQPAICFYAILWGIGAGIVCALINIARASKNKILLVVSDFCSSTVFGLSYIVFSLIYTKGVGWLYTLISLSVGFCAVYFFLCFVFDKLKKFYKNRNKKTR